MAKMATNSNPNTNSNTNAGGLDMAKMVANFENGTELRKLQKALRRPVGAKSVSLRQ